MNGRDWVGGLGFLLCVLGALSALVVAALHSAIAFAGASFGVGFLLIMMSWD